MRCRTMSSTPITERVNPRPRIVIIGAGFAGLWAVRSLRRTAVDILLIDRSNHHTFQPLLYQVATAGLAAPSIAAPLRHILRRQRNVTVLLGNVTEIETTTRRVVADGASYAYDYLFVATGVTHTYFGHDEWQSDALGLKTLDDALAMRARILTAFERAEAASDPSEQAAWLTFVIVGGGPTGVELAGTLAEIARHTLKGEFRRMNPASARILLLEAGPRILPAFVEPLSRYAEKALRRLGVTVHTGQAVTQVAPSGVSLGGEQIAARTVLWAAGVEASPLGRAARGRYRSYRAGARLFGPEYRGSSRGFRRRRSGPRQQRLGQRSWPCTGRQTNGNTCRSLAAGATSWRTHPAVSISRLRSARHHRPERGSRAAWASEAYGHHRLVVLADGAHLLSGWFPQPSGGTDRLGERLLDLSPRRADHSELTAGFIGAITGVGPGAAAPLGEPYVPHCR